MTELINTDENSQEFLVELERRIKLAKNPKNRISLELAKKNIIEKYTKLFSYNQLHNKSIFLLSI